MKPTDDELESMAYTLEKYLNDASLKDNAKNAQSIVSLLAEDLAFMRACKSRDKQVWNAAIEAAAKAAQGQHRETSVLDPESSFFGTDMTPDRSEWGRGIQRGREQSAAAILDLKKGQTDE